MTPSYDPVSAASASLTTWFRAQPDDPVLQETLPYLGTERYVHDASVSALADALLSEQPSLDGGASGDLLLECFTLALDLADWDCVRANLASDPKETHDAQ